MESRIIFSKVGMLYELAEDVMTHLSAFIISTTAKMLAKVANMVPFLGNLATTQYEVAVTISEIESNLKDRVENSATIWFNLDPSITPIVKEAIDKQLQGQKATA